jgi:hypothetical protein
MTARIGKQRGQLVRPSQHTTQGFSDYSLVSSESRGMFRRPVHLQAHTKDQWKLTTQRLSMESS